MAGLPRRRREAARRLSKRFDEDTLPAIQHVVGFLWTEAVHLVRGFRQHRRPTEAASVASDSRRPAVMKKTVKEKLLRTLADKPAVVTIFRQRPFAVPV